MDGIGVEGVGRMADTVQDLVGSIHGGQVLGVGAHVAQEGLDIGRGALGFAKRQDGRRVQRAGLALQTHSQERLTLHPCAQGKWGKIRVQTGGNVTRQTAVRKHITAVGCDIHFQHSGAVAHVHGVHRKPQRGQELAEGLGTHGVQCRQLLLQSFEFDEHQSSPPMVLRNRWSFSKKRRRSGVWLTIMAMRSTPMPKANPLHSFGSMPA